MLRRAATTAVTTAVTVVLAMVLAAVPAFAQGLENVEPTLAECQAFVQENGVPETRPVWENRGYSGWDVCLNMAYDGNLAGYFASADANADGRLDAVEQGAYMNSVLGPMSDPDQSPLTLDKCRALISKNGVPAERPFVDWSNRGYGEVEVCQSLAYDGNLEGSFASADTNADGRLDKAEQGAYIASMTRGAGQATSQAQDESVVHGQYQASHAQEQYEDSGSNAAQTETTTPEFTIPAEPAISAPPVGEPTASTASVEPVEEEPEERQGVLSAVNTAVEGMLPSTGGVTILGVLGSAALLTGGFLAYRRFL